MKNINEKTVMLQPKASFWSNILVSLCGVAAVCQSYAEFDLVVNKGLLIFVFCSTLAYYTVARFKYYNIAAKYTQNLKVFFKNSGIDMLVVIVLLVICWVYWLQFSFAQKIITGVAMLLNMAYILPFVHVNKMQRINLRALGLLKIFIVSCVWSMVVVLLPLVELRTEAFEIILKFMGVFCLVFALMIPFEIRDLQSDKLDGIRNIVSIGGRKFIILCGVMAYGLHLFLHMQLGMYFRSAVMLFVVFAWVIFYARKPRNAFFYAAVVDGMIILESALVIVDKIIYA